MVTPCYTTMHVFVKSKMVLVGQVVFVFSAEGSHLNRAGGKGCRAGDVCLIQKLS
jgi:hypothetical protein